MARRKELRQHNLVDVTRFRDQEEKYSRSREVIRVVIDGLSIKGKKIIQCMHIGGLFMRQSSSYSFDTNVRTPSPT